MADFKIQVNRGNKSPDKWDQRKSTGAFQGAEDGFNVRTALEFRANEALTEMLTSTDKLSEIVRPGDNALQVFNRITQLMVDKQPEVFGPAANLLGLGGAGPVDLDMFVYDND
jgi:hypothetical protein